MQEAVPIPQSGVVTGGDRKEPKTILDQIVATLSEPLEKPGQEGLHKLTNGRCMKNGGKIKNNSTSKKKKGDIERLQLCNDCAKAFLHGAAKVKEKMEERRPDSWPCDECDQRAHRDVLLPDFFYLKQAMPDVMPFFAMSPLTRSGCGLWVKDMGYVWLEYGDILVGRGDLVHAGIGYPLGDEDFHRFHAFIATEEIDYDGNIYQVFKPK